MMPPSAVNDTARQQMTDHRYQWEDAEWFAWGDTVSKASATTFKIAADVTSRYLADRRAKIFDTTTKYATIVSSSYSAPDTTITLSFDNDSSLGASFSAVALAILTPTNSSIPRTFQKNRNLIIGGNFGTNPWQRGTSFTCNASSTYTADRFVGYAVGAGVFNVLKTADSPTISQSGVYSTSCLHVDVTTADAALAASDDYQIYYRIEGYDASPIGFGQTNAKNITLSFWHKHTVTGTYCVGFRNSATNRSYVAEYTQTTTDTWEKATITIQADTTGTWLYTNGVGLDLVFAIAAGSDFQITGGVWGATSGYITSNQVNGMSSTSNNFKLNLIQLEISNSATAFEVEDITTTLGKCQRYYWKSFSQGVTPAQAIGSYVGTISYSIWVGANTNAYQQVQPFPVVMRTTPTVTFYNPISANTKWYNASTGADSGVSGSGGQLSDRLLLAQANQVVGDLAAQHLYIHATADAEL